MTTCSICNNGFRIENHVVVDAVFERISMVKEIFTPLELNCHHIFHYSCISQKLHEQVSDKSRQLSCPTCNRVIDFGKDNIPWGVCFSSNFETKVYLKNEEICQWKEGKIDSFYIGSDLFTDVEGIFKAVD